MKKNILTFVCLMCTLMVSAQKNYSDEEISAGWAKKTITGVKDGDILTLFKAFNNTWRTVPGSELLAHPVTNTGDEDAYAIVVDRPNGYISAQELGDDGEDIAACVWKRSNGHKLFAVVYTPYHGLTPHPIALFYDYDAAKKTLTPENHVLSNFVPSYNDPCVDMVHIKLPQQGKAVVVEEYIMPWGFSIKHTYQWDGMRPKFSETQIENIDRMCRQYDNLYQLEEKVKYTKYVLYDFDEDDNPELWLLSENEENQGIYSIVQDNILMLASTYYKTHLLFHPQVVGSAGGCGTGCFRAEYTAIEKSQPKYRFVDQQSYNYQKDEMESTYYKNDKEISNAEGERILKQYGEPLDINPKKRSLK
jgi:hypothetical protein